MTTAPAHHEHPDERADARTDAAGQPARHRRVLVVMCLSLATVVSAVASLNVALPSIARDTRATQTQLSWIIDAYALVFAALLLPAGALGDRYGRRRALLAGLAVFGAASIAATTVSDANALIALRGLLGLGAALVMPATLSTITSTFPAEQKPRAIGIWAGVAGGSAILGLLTSGLLLEAYSWRVVFGLNIVLAAAAIAGTLRVVPESADERPPGLDVVGALIAVVGLSAVVYSIIEAPEAGWLTARTLVGVGGGLIVLVGFVVWELGRPAPMLDPRLFRIPGFAAGMASMTVQFFAFFGFMFAMLQYLQLVRGDSALIAALSLLPMVGTMMPSARLAPHVAARVGTRRVCVTGLLFLVGGFVVLTQLDTGSSYWLIVAGVIPLGLGMGMAMTPATSAVTDALPAAKQGIGSAMNDLARELGGALGIAVLASVLNATYRSHLHLGGVPEPVAEHARSSLALASQLGNGVKAHAQQAFVSGMHAALICAAVAVGLAAIAVTVLLRPRSNEDGAAELGEAAGPDLPSSELPASLNM